METVQFKKQMDRIKSSFKSFSPERNDLVWKKVRNVDASLFSMIVDDIIGNNKTVPTVEDFTNKIGPYLNAQEPEGCNSCDYTGRILQDQIEKCPITGKDTSYRYAYRCRCELGKTFQNYQPYDFDDF